MRRKPLPQKYNYVIQETTTVRNLQFRINISGFLILIRNLFFH